MLPDGRAATLCLSHVRREPPVAVPSTAGSFGFRLASEAIRRVSSALTEDWIFGNGRTLGPPVAIRLRGALARCMRAEPHERSFRDVHWAQEILKVGAEAQAIGSSCGLSAPHAG